MHFQLQHRIERDAIEKTGRFGVSVWSVRLRSAAVQNGEEGLRE